jgi:energy-coupling factor transport system permease protein
MRLAYLPGDSFFHRMDPTAKLVWNLLAAATIVLNIAPGYSALCFAYVAALALVAARLPLRRYVGLLAGFATFGAVLALWQVVYNPAGSQVLWQWGVLRVTVEGIGFGVAVFFRLLTLTSLAAIFTLTTDPARLVESLMQVARVPYRLAYTVYAGLRFLPLLEDEAQVITRAHLVRGVGATGAGPVARLRLGASLMVPLLVSGIRRARAAAIAMDSRAFGAYPQRTVLYPVRVDRLALAWALAHALLLAALFYYFVILGQGQVLTG